MNADQIRSLVESEDDDGMLDMSMKDAFASDLDVALMDIQNEANSLLGRLAGGGHLDALLAKYPNMQEDAIAIAVMRMACERSGSLGAERVYKWFKRHAPYL